MEVEMKMFTFEGEDAQNFTRVVKAAHLYAALQEVALRRHLLAQDIVIYDWVERGGEEAIRIGSLLELGELTVDSDTAVMDRVREEVEKKGSLDGFFEAVNGDALTEERLYKAARNLAACLWVAKIMRIAEAENIEKACDIVQAAFEKKLTDEGAERAFVDGKALAKAQYREFAASRRDPSAPIN